MYAMPALAEALRDEDMTRTLKKGGPSLRRRKASALDVNAENLRLWRQAIKDFN